MSEIIILEFFQNQLCRKAAEKKLQKSIHRDLIRINKKYSVYMLIYVYKHTLI